MAGKPLDKKRSKTKSQRSADGTRKLASDHGRAKAKSGGEAQKRSVSKKGAAARSGSRKA